MSSGNLLDGARQNIYEDHFFFFRAKGWKLDHWPKHASSVGNSWLEKKILGSK